MSIYPLPSLRDVDKAATLIESKILQTPVKTSPYIDAIATNNVRQYKSSPDIRVFFKCENLQTTNSFKFRGATHFIAKLADHELKKGIVAYSTGKYPNNTCALFHQERLHEAHVHMQSGNHALAVSHATHLASLTRSIAIPTTLILPPTCPPAKLAATQSHNATVLLAPSSDPQSRIDLANQITRSTSATLIPASCHSSIVLGAATAIREFTTQVADLDAIVVPSGGGGLLVGAIAVCKSLGIRVYAAEPSAGGPGLRHALQTGSRNEKVEGGETVADGLRCLTGSANWEHIREGVQGCFGISEEEIKRAVKVGCEELGDVIEGSGAVGLGVVLCREWAREVARIGKEKMGKGTAGGSEVRVGVVVTGGNVRVEDLLGMVPDLDLSRLPVRLM